MRRLAARCLVAERVRLKREKSSIDDFALFVSAGFDNSVFWGVINISSGILLFFFRHIFASDFLRLAIVKNEKMKKGNSKGHEIYMENSEEIKRMKKSAEGMMLSMHGKTNLFYLTAICLALLICAAVFLHSH